MVRVLVTMRGFALANTRHTRFGIASLIVTALLGLLAASATMLLGFTAPLRGGDAQIALVVLAWVAGRVGFAAFSGADAALPLDSFRMLPIHRASLSRALLALGFVDPALLFFALACGSLVAFGFRLDLASGIVAVVGALLLIALTSVLSTIVSALVPAGSRRRQDVGTLLAAVVISAVFVMSTLTPTLLAALASGHAGVLAWTLRIIPTGWPGDAAVLNATGYSWAAALVVLALAGVCVALAAYWPRVLTNRLESVGGSGRRGGGGRRRRILPATPVGGVVSRELRLWVRDPTRAGFLLISMVVGLGVCVVPLMSKGADLLLPFAGIGTAIIAAGIAGNVYGFDGPGFGLVLTSPNGERADVRGRQLAWLLIVGPYSTLLSLGGLLIAGQPAAWPWVCGLLPAVIGAATGVAILVSAIAPQPLDDGGGPTPTWTVKVYASLTFTALATSPVLALLILGSALNAPWLAWLGVPVGIAVGTVLAVSLGRAAVTRLQRRGPEMLDVLASSPSGRR